MKQRKEIEAVHKHDLTVLLKNLGLLADFNAGEINCKFCEETINEGNVGLIYPENNKILITCAKLECMEKLHKRQL